MIILDDMANIGKHVQPGTVDLVILDPPYGIGNSKLSHAAKNWKKSDEDWDTFSSLDEQYDFYVRMFDTIWPLLKPTGNIFCWGSFHSIYLCGEIMQRRHSAKLVNSIVWEKVNAFFSVTCSSLIEGTEHCIWAAKTKDFYFDYQQSKKYNYDKQLRNVWTKPLTPNAERVGHPHQKPEWIYDRIVRIASPEGGFVVDPMSGSGTTACVCKASGRNYLCVEKNPKYYEISVDRLSNMPKEQVFNETCDPDTGKQGQVF